MTTPELIERLESALAQVAKPDKGMTFSNSSSGERRFDPITGEPFYSISRPAELTIYGENALALKWIIDNADQLLAALKAQEAQHREKGK
jgi:hypothetical protein